MRKFFKIVSGVFSPLIVPCYSIALALSVTALCVIPFGVRMIVLSICAIFLFLIPALVVYALYRAGVISDPGLNERRDRTVPYIVVMVCYILCGYYFFRISAPWWLVGVIGGALLTILISLIVNLWWKISGHMAAMGGLTAVAFFIAAKHIGVIPMLWPMIICVMLTGLVASARLYLNRHTPLQVVAGTANGFICVYLGACAGYALQLAAA